MEPFVRRQAMYAASQGQPLFAWLHRPNAATDHGVVICPPHGFEQVHSHRSLRQLADDLARAGHLVCRFDYHGTGDSAGTDEDPDRVAVWRSNIADILQWMRLEHGCRRLSVIGVRLGALLALDAASQQPLANLVLWVPVDKGGQYVREMEALSLTSGPAAANSDDIEAAGFVVTRQTADDLVKLDAVNSRPRCQRALIVARDDLSENRELVDHLIRQGVDATQIREPGYADMMALPHETQVPHHAIAAIVGWLSGAAKGDRPVQVEINGSTEAAVAANVRETIAPINGPPELFAIVTQPVAVAPPDLPLIVLLNGGSAYHVGPNRLHVLLARELASHGFQVMRLDLAGLGDSDADDDARENDPYVSTIFRDVDLALRYVERHFGASRIVLMGLCSGAYAAFQAAAQFSNPVFVECVLINPLTFYWTDGMSLSSPRAKELKDFHYYMGAALQPSKWFKIFSGRTKIGLMGTLKMVVQRFRHRPRAHSSDIIQSSCLSDAHVTHPRQDDLPGDLDRMIRAGRNIACFFSRSDPGYSILMYHARHKAKALCRAGKMNVFFIEDADHTFSRRTPRRNVIRAIIEYLCK
jgi:alpha-beta hydrolase superfamily lysophospholipase